MATGEQAPHAAANAKAAKQAGSGAQKSSASLKDTAAKVAQGTIGK